MSFDDLPREKVRPGEVWRCSSPYTLGGQHFAKSHKRNRIEQILLVIRIEERPLGSKIIAIDEAGNVHDYWKAVGDPYWEKIIL